MTIQNTSLNPADVATGGGTFAPNLSNGNLTLTGQQSSNYCAIRTVDALTGGLWVWQCRINALGNFTPGVGIAATAASLNAFGATGANWPGGLVWLNSGAVYMNGVANVTAWDAWNTGDLLTFAVHTELGLIWSKVNDGPWNKSLTADPATNIGGFDFGSALGTAVSPVAWMNNFNSFLGAGQVTFNFAFAPGIPKPNGAPWLIWAGVVIGNNGPPRYSSTVAGTFGDPARGFGGLDFSASAWDGVTGSQPNPFFLTAQGTGDGNVTLNTNPPPQHAPKGFKPGWPGFTQWTGLQGSAAPAGAFVGFPASQGLAQSDVGFHFGRYYFEYTIGQDIFTQVTGIGVGRAGPDITAWFAGGGFSTTNRSGGAMVQGGNILNSFVGDLETQKLAGPAIGGGTAPAGTIIGVAVQLGAFIPVVYDVQQAQPVPLVCVPCRELLIGPNGFGGFGR